MKRHPLPIIAMLACAVLGGCKEKPQAPASSKADAGATPTDPAVDPALARALRDVGRPSPSGQAAAPGRQPPEKGVFAPGAADRELALGAPAQLAVGAEGSAPKAVARGLVLAAGKPREVAYTVAVRTGPRAALPTLDFLVALDAEAPKSGDEGPNGAARGLDVSARVTAARLSKEQPGALPPGLDREVQHMKGSRFMYRAAPGGGVLDVKVEIQKDVEPGLGRVLASVAEMAGTLHAPFPAAPVGTGAFWMVTSRERYVGLDVVVYRMVRIERIEGTETTLSVNTRRYVAGGRVDFPGLPEHRVDEFRGEGRGELVVTPDRGIVRAQLQDTLLANLEPQGEPGRRVTIQLEVSAAIRTADGS